MKSYGSLRISAFLACLMTIFVVTACAIPQEMSGVSGAPSHTGHVEVRATLNGKDVTALCMAMAVGESSSMPIMLELSSSGALSADLMPGNYQVIIMMEQSRPGAMPNSALISLVMAAGQRISRTVILGQPGDPGVEQGYAEDGATPAPSAPEGTTQRTDVDFSRVPDQAEVIRIAREYLAEYHPRLSPGERAFVDKCPVSSDDLTTAAAGIAGVGASRAVAVVLACEAVIHDPQHALALNNLGAILRLIGSVPEGVAVLAAAQAIAPASPLVLTNLANAAYQLGETKRAKELYETVLMVAPAFGPAVAGLGFTKLTNGQWDAGANLLAEAVNTSYNPNIGAAIKEASRRSEGSSPSPPAWKSRTGSRPAGGVFVAVRADWSTMYAAVESADALGPTLSKLKKQDADIVMQLNKALSPSGSGAQQPTAGAPISYDKQLLYLDLIMEHYHGKFLDSLEALGEVMLTLSDHHARLANVTMEYMDRLGAAGSEQERKIIQQEYCVKKNAITNQAYAVLKPAFVAFRDTAEHTGTQLWKESSAVLAEVYDPAIHRICDLELQRIINSELIGVAEQASKLPGFFRITTECPYCGPDAEEGESQNPNAPSSKRNSCPFTEGKKLSISLGPISYKVDCTTVSLEFAMGVAGGFTWDFKDKQVTSVFAGMGASAGFGLEAGAKAGFELTFGSDGSLTDIAASASVSGGMANVATVEADSLAGIVVGAGPVQMPAR